jgi:hypothetical protein
MQGWHGSLNRLQSGRTYGESLALLVHVHDGAYCIFCFVAFPNVSVAKYVNDASVRAARIILVLPILFPTSKGARGRESHCGSSHRSGVILSLPYNGRLLCGPVPTPSRICVQLRQPVTKVTAHEAERELRICKLGHIILFD